MTLLRIARGHPRLLIATATGLVATLLLPPSLNPLRRALLGWDAGTLTMLVLAADLFTRERDRTIAQDAAAQEEGEWSIFWITLVAVLASFAAVLGEYASLKNPNAPDHAAHLALVAVTLLLSWLVTHTFFALRYAHEYYGTTGGAATVDKGLEFPGDMPPDYWDFFYFSLVLGMTFQVSDVQITSRKLRRLASAHGLLSFLFNTIIIALSVNLGASLL